MPRHTLAVAALACLLPLGALAQIQVPGGHFIENWDLDGDGQVTLAETTEKRGDIFYMFDQDDNGALDSAEYDLFDETRQADMDANEGGHGRGPMRGVNQGMLRETTDANGDGSVTEAEFMAPIGDWFATMDRNGDGVLTTGDFGQGG